MTFLLTVALTALALALLVPSAVLLVQCLAAVLPASSRQRFQPASRPTLAVLVPAHNEAEVIAGTLESITAQLVDDDRLVVVADNCTDSTEQVARSCGAMVCPRNEPERRGKGFALQWGLDAIRSDPPQVVVIADADCVLHDECLQRLAGLAVASNRPVQAAYLMPPPNGARPTDVVSSLAVLVKNRVRPRGMDRLGLPCLLTGSGMAFPWQLIASTRLAGDNIVEDMQLAVDMSLSGSPPLYCDAAMLTAPLPASRGAARSQRTRWEHGHLRTLLGQAPRLIAAVLSRPRLHLLATLLDLSVPPLSLLALMWSLVAAASLVWGLWTAEWLPSLLCGSSGGMLLFAIGAAWFRFARRTVPLTTMLSIPSYLLWKLPLYAAFLLNRQRKWVRTERSSE